MSIRLKVVTAQLEIACNVYGPADGVPVILMHGFPYDAYSCEDAAKLLAAQGCRVVTPWLRGFGDTRFLSSSTLRTGQQAAIGSDLHALIDSLFDRPVVLAGYDWGGRAACIVSALWPEQVRGLITCNGYNIQDIAGSMIPEAPELEAKYWYQYYFHSERGQRALQENRDTLTRFLWQSWSPSWDFDDSTFQRSALAFNNPDFVDIVIHSYRHRYGLVVGYSEYDALEKKLASKPRIPVPTISMDGEDNQVWPELEKPRVRDFPDLVDYRRFDGIGHNVPQEAPRRFAKAVLDIIEHTA